MTDTTNNYFTTHEINEIPFSVGISEYTITSEFNTNDTLKIYIYRPVTLTNNNIVIYLPGRNGNGKEYALQTTFLNEYNSSLGVILDFAHDKSTSEYEYCNLFPQSSYDQTNNILLPNSTFNLESEWNCHWVFDAFQFVQSIWSQAPTSYILYGIDAGSLYVGNFLFLFDIMTYPNKTAPLKTILGVSSFYFFPTGQGRLSTNIIGNVNTNTTSTPVYPELINYQDLNIKNFQSIQTNLINSLNNDNCLETYYSYVSNFYSLMQNSINPALENINDPTIYDLDTSLNSDYIFPQGPGNLPLSNIDLMNCKAFFLQSNILYILYMKDTNIYGGVTAEGKNIPNLMSNDQSSTQGPFRLFRGINCYFSNQIACSNMDLPFNMNYCIIPGCGHNSNFSDHTAITANAFSSFMAPNYAFNPAWFYYLKKSLFK